MLFVILIDLMALAELLRIRFFVPVVYTGIHISESSYGRYLKSLDLKSPFVSYNDPVALRSRIFIDIGFLCIA